MSDKYSKHTNVVRELDFNTILLLLTPFWLSMLFINGKVMMEINREWSSEEVKRAVRN
jgi:hypothetical protein